jgi:hypothetical protein
MSSRRWDRPVRNGSTLANVGLCRSVWNQRRSLHRIRRSTARTFRQSNHSRECVLYASKGLFLYHLLETFFFCLIYRLRATTQP